MTLEELEIVTIMTGILIAVCMARTFYGIHVWLTGMIK